MQRSLSPLREHRDSMENKIVKILYENLKGNGLFDTDWLVQNDVGFME